MDRTPVGELFPSGGLSLTLQNQRTKPVGEAEQLLVLV